MLFVSLTPYCCSNLYIPSSTKWSEIQIVCLKHWTFQLVHRLGTSRSIVAKFTTNVLKLIQGHSRIPERYKGHSRFPTRISGFVNSLNPFVLEKAPFNLFGCLKICGVGAAVNHKIDKTNKTYGFFRRVADWFEIEVRNTLRTKSIPMAKQLVSPLLKHHISDTYIFR